MKKIALCLMVTFLSLTFCPILSIAATTAASSSPVTSKPAESAEAKTLLLRLDEIKAMDKSNLKPSEKKNLRKEVRSIKHQLKRIGGGVYLSAGAIIIIILLLIILL
ncbi:MAG: hypothetical protein NT175_04975 [Bacteroidetes bacterium]|nr:hypothetical protein [Bacteroidota bacterium]